MAKLIINNSDFSKRLKDFNLSCKSCNSKNVTLEIDWAAYLDNSWCNIWVLCDDCKNDEEIYYA